MLEIIKQFVNPTTIDLNHRFKSWEHCFIAFNNEQKDIDSLSLNLAFYLASWGMYRGSSGLLWKDYKIHNKAVEIILKYPELKSQNIGLINIDRILQLRNELIEFYSSVHFYNGKNSLPNKVTPTDTLLSKIILGTTGALPAFDRYFNIGFKKNPNLKITQENISEIYDFANCKINEITICQQYINKTLNFNYPIMKIIDMYFWQTGYNESK